MSKFKVGDRVRVIDASGGGKVGHEHVIAKAEEGEYYEFERNPYVIGLFGRCLELVPAADWQPKVGDRVVVTDNVNGAGVAMDFCYKVGETYTVTKESSFKGAWILDGKDRFLYARQFKPFRIEAGRYYRSANGKKVGPMADAAPDKWMYVKDRLGTWHHDGTAHSAYSGTAAYYGNLIAEWAEPAAAKVNVAATVDYQADEYGSGVAAKPKFKVGDVVAGRGAFGSKRRGRITQVDDTDDWLTYRVDDRDTWLTADSVELVANDNAPVAQQPAADEDDSPKLKKGDRVRLVNEEYLSDYGLKVGDVGTVNENESFAPFVRWDRTGETWCDVQASFELLVPTAIVALIENGQPKPATRPYVHATVESANVEAARLASVHKGKSFGVYVLTGEPAFVERTYEHEWQRQAAEGKTPGAIVSLERSTGISRAAATAAVRDFLAAA